MVNNMKSIEANAKGNLRTTSPVILILICGILCMLSVASETKSTGTLKFRVEEKKTVSFSKNEFRLQADDVRKSDNKNISTLEQNLKITAFGDVKIYIVWKDLTSIVSGPDPNSNDEFSSANITLLAKLDKIKKPILTWSRRIETLGGGKAGGPSSTIVASGKKISDFTRFYAVSGVYPFGKTISAGYAENQAFFLRVDKCQKPKASGIKALPREEKLISLLVAGTPKVKMAAAKKLGEMNSKVSVPYLLVEMRDKYGPIIYEDDPNSDDPHHKLVYVISNGKKVPYVDYHGPLFEAMHKISVPYFGNDAKWYAAIEGWIRENGMGDLLDKLTGPVKRK